MRKNGGRIISLFGGAGRRDETTRAERGEIGGKYSDIVIVTEDDSRDEDPKKIAEMFVEGAEKAGKVRDKDLFVELNRAKAIRKACELAKKGDLVLILGKGHEKTILRADGPHPFEDLKVTEKVVKKLLK
jgi:UDP-N-acetylmuramoyl-L-alanyl-D-glutamate--2,6-diaminopimelate ligase